MPSIHSNRNNLYKKVEDDMKPSSAEANTHHTESHLYNSAQDFFDDILGRGDGDPDKWGNPDEATDVE